MTELATGYISLVVETSKIPKQVGDAMKGVEGQADRAGRGMGSRMASGMGGVLKKSAIGVGVAAGGAVAAGMAKGIGRLSAIEQAESKLSGLGNSAKDVEGIMTNALSSVRGTAFGLEEAATVAAGMVAAGVKPGKELEGVLKTVGDTAAIAGVSMQDMGSIFGKVAATGKLQGDELMQLSDAGIPALSLLSTHLGKTTEEVRKMVSDGKVGFDDFAAAMESGMGGAALKMGDTTVGAMKNMMAAAGRLGATLAGPLFTQAGSAFRGITDLLDTMEGKAGPVMAELEAWMTGALIPGLAELAGSARETWEAFRSSELVTTSMTRLEGIFSSLLDSGLRVAPAIGDIVDSLGRASAAIGVSTWEMLLSVLEASASILDATLVPALEFTANVMQDNQTAVTALVGAFMAFKTIPGIMARIAPAFTPLASGASSAGTSISEFAGAVRDSYKWMGQANPQMGLLGQSAAILGTNAGAAAKGGMAALGRATSNLLGVFGGPLGAALTGVTIAATASIGANQKLESSQRALQEASLDLAMAQTDMWSEIGDAAGVADAVVDQIRAVRAEMDAAISGEQRGFGAWVSRAWNDLGLTLKDNFTFDFTPEMGGKQEAQNFANDLADAAELAKGALDELKMSNDDIAAAVSGSAGDWDAFALRLGAVQDGGQEALAGIQPLRDEFVQLQEAQRLASPGALELADAVDVLADAAASGEDKLSALKRALQAIGIGETDAEASMFELAEAVDEVVEAAVKGVDHVDGFGDSLLNLEGKLDPNVKNAQALRNELGPLRDTIQSSAMATGDAAGAFDAAGPAIEALAEKYGLTTEKIREFLGATPEQLDLLVSVDGADEVRQKLVEVALAMDNLPDDEPKVFTTRLDEATAADTIAGLEAIGYKVQEIEGQPGMVRITADGTVAVAGMNAIAAQLSGLASSVATPRIDADATIFRLEDEAVRASLQNLDFSHVDPSVGAIIDDFINGRDVTLAELQRIDATVADPHIKAEISEALQKSKIVNDALDRAARERTAIITIEQRGSLGARAYSSSGTAVGQHYADGGRLPLSGPGTSTTDGILGVGSDGTPTAWVDKGEWVVNGRASAKYNGLLSRINRDDPSVRHLQGYADGGMVSADEVLDFLHNRDGLASRSLQGAPYLWGQVNWGDCSGAQAAAWRFAAGLDPFGGRFATGNMLEAVQALGGRPGPGGPDDLTSAWYNGGPGGGHTTGHVGGVNFEMGGGAGGIGKIGGAAASPFSGPWQHIYHLPLSDPFDWSDKPYSGRRGAGLTIGDYAADQFSGRTSFGARGGAGGASQRPTTWSGIAGDTAAAMVSGLTEDALGVFGIPNQLPPALQAWNMLNEPVGDGPTDWDLSVLAARTKQLDAEVQVRQQFVDEAAKAVDAVNTSPVGNALPAQMVAAQDQVAAERRELERVRTEWEAARTRLDEALGARAAALATDNSGASDKELAEIAGKATAEVAKDIDITPVYDPSKRAEQWIPVIDKVLREKGLPLSYRDAVVHRMNQESGGDPRAENDWDSNAAAGDRSKGGMQTTTATFNAFKDPGFGDIWKLEDNLRASINYVTRDPKFQGRTLEDVYRQAGGYFRGGEVELPPGMQPGVDNIPAWLTLGERVVRNGPSQRYAEEIDAMNAGTFRSGGDETHFHFQVLSMDEAERRRRELERRRTTEKVGPR